MGKGKIRGEILGEILASAVVGGISQGPYWQNIMKNWINGFESVREKGKGSLDPPQNAERQVKNGKAKKPKRKSTWLLKYKRDRKEGSLREKRQDERLCSKGEKKGRGVFCERNNVRGKKEKRSF